MSALPFDLFTSAMAPTPPVPAAKIGEHRMRPYQRECVDGVFRALENSRSTLVVAATGTGKTIIMGHIVDEWKTGRVMLLAHRKELIEQGRDKVRHVTGERPSIEMADSYADLHRSRSRVVVS